MTAFQDRVPKAELKRIIGGYSDLVEERIAKGWTAFIASFMFKPLHSGLEGSKRQMERAISEAYNISLCYLYRQPAKALNKPIWLICPDFPVPKRAKASTRQVKLNDGLHYGAILLIPPGTRVGDDFDLHIANRQSLCRRNNSTIDRIYIDPISETPRKATRYVFKAITNGRATIDEIMILNGKLDSSHPTPKLLKTA